MKKILLSSLLLVGLYANAQISLTASAGTATATYTNLKGAFDAINAGTHQGNINISITASTTETATAVLNAVSTYTSVYIKPSVAATVTGSIASSPVVTILGSNVTIDGSTSVGGTTKDLTFSNTATTGASVIYMGSPSSTAPLTNVTVKNSILTSGGNTSTNFVIANGSTAAGFFNNITVQNNTFNSGYNGVFVLADGTAISNGDNLLITGNTITNNFVQNGIYIAGVTGTATVTNNNIAIVRPSTGTTTTPAASVGINLGTNTNSATISGNTISVKNTNTSTTGINYASGIYITPGANNVMTNVFNNTITEVSGILTYINSNGIYVGGATANVKIHANKISGLKNNNPAGTPMQGILLGSSSTAANVVAYNNVISDIQATAAAQLSGIYVFSGGGYRLYSNTVNLNTSNAETGISTGLYVMSTATSLDIRNNIFVNNKTSGTRYALYSAATNAAFTNINYNDYYTTGTALGFIGSARNTLADVQAGFGQNANSVNVSPVFISATDFNLNPAAVGNASLSDSGTPLAEVTVDHLGAPRGATPDLGAYEFVYTLAISEAGKTGDNISVYPNPFADVIKISNLKNIKSINLSDMSGKIVKTLPPSNEIDLRDLNSGIYLLSFQFDNGQFKTVKVIKK